MRAVPKHVNAAVTQFVSAGSDLRDYADVESHAKSGGTWALGADLRAPVARAFPPAPGRPVLGSEIADLVVVPTP